VTNPTMASDFTGLYVGIAGTLAATKPGKAPHSHWASTVTAIDPGITILLGGQLSEAVCYDTPPSDIAGCPR
jgi:hypothetical protein